MTVQYLGGTQTDSFEVGDWQSARDPKEVKTQLEVGALGQGSDKKAKVSGLARENKCWANLHFGSVQKIPKASLHMH